ncbi:MAG TPA: hypothetical protein EYO61_02880 [Campylobacterales bacterium]|nr:hypothetical protein [Campylobacterales bacterium]HIO71186.1 hypothetical protein [Campylobacterales bacterium]
MEQLFINFGAEIITLHILSAVIWVGGMIAVRFAVHQVIHSITPENVRVEKALNVMKNLFFLVLPFIFILVVTGIIMIYGLGHKGDMGVHIKEGLWTLMFLNFAVMFFRRKKAEQLSKENLEEAKKQMMIISKFMLPANIIFGITAIYMGGVLRGF